MTVRYSPSATTQSFFGRYFKRVVGMMPAVGFPREFMYFFVPLRLMKLFALIFFFLLSFLSGGRTEIVSANISCSNQYNISEYPSDKETVDYRQNREICITASQGYTFAGGGSTNSISVRTTQSLKRINPQIRSTFRIVKGGKVIDNNHLHPFLARSVVHLAGIYISERYLFSICCLRL